MSCVFIPVIFICVGIIWAIGYPDCLWNDLHYDKVMTQVLLENGR